MLSSSSSLNSQTRVTNKGVNLTATRNIDIVSELGDLTTAGARLESHQGDINVSAVQGNILAGTYTDIDQTRSEYESSSFFGSTRNYATDNRFVTGTAALAAVDLTLVSGQDTELVGAYLSAGHDLNLNVGGDLRVIGAISSEREDFFESKLGAVTATTETERSFKESAVYTTLLSGGGLAINVGGETQLTLYNYENEDAPSAADVYPEELLALANLILLNEELADEYFYDKTTTLSPAFIAILTIVVTMGVGSFISAAGIPALGTPAVAATSTNLAIPATLTTAGQATAAFAASAIVGSTNGVVSGDFDLGDILKNAAFAAATSYLASSINLQGQGKTPEALAEAEKANQLTGVGKALDKKFSILGGSWGKPYNTALFGEKLTAANVLERAFDGAIQSGLSSAVYGTDFKTGLRNSVVRTIVALGLADVQTEIGGVFNDENGDPINGGEGSFGHVALHAIAGCAAAEASGADCGAGAAGAVAQTIYAESLNGTTLSLEQQKRNIAVIAGAVGYLFSGGNAENVSAASSIAVSGLANNRQLHLNEKEILAEIFGHDVVDEDVFDKDQSEFSAYELRVLATACARVHCADHVNSDDPTYTQRRALQDQGITLVHAGDQAFQDLLVATVNYFQENNLPFGVNSLTITSLHEENKKLSGQVQGGFLYTGFDARYDIALATGIDIYGQARAESGPASIPEEAVNEAIAALGTFASFADCVATSQAACQTLWDNATQAVSGTVAAIRSIPDYPELLANNELAIARFIDGSLSREEFVTILADSGRIAGTAETVIVGLGLTALSGGAFLNDRIRYDATNSTLDDLFDSSGYSTAEYEVYAQRKLTNGDIPRSPEDYITIRQQFDKGSAAHNAAVTNEVTLLNQTYPNGGFMENRAVNAADGCITCRPDIIVYDADTNTLHVIEVKTGDADLTPNQAIVYPNIADGSATMNTSQLMQLGIDTSFAGRPLSDITGINIIVEEIRR